MHSFEELNAKINRLKRDGGVGYTEIKRVSLIDWGNYPYGTSIPGELFGEAGELLLRSSDVISNEELESIAIWRKALPSGPITDENFYTKESLIFDETEETRSWRTPEDMLAVVCFLHDIQVDEALTIRKGTYILRAESTYERVWTSEIHYKTETIHPIDPKYLPEGFGGGGLPVVEFEEMPKLGQIVALSEKQIEQVKAALAAGDYCIVYFMDTFISAIARRIPGTDMFVVSIWTPNQQHQLFVVGSEDGQEYVGGFTTL